MLIRPATAADYEAANALYQTTIGENFKLDRSLWEAVCADGERYRPLIARDADGSPMGMAVVVVSSDLEEVLGLSHRILVLARGRNQGILRAEQATNVAVMELATV